MNFQWANILSTKTAFEFWSTVNYYYREFANPSTNLCINNFHLKLRKQCVWQRIWNETSCTIQNEKYFSFEFRSARIMCLCNSSVRPVCAFVMYILTEGECPRLIPRPYFSGTEWLGNGVNNEKREHFLKMSENDRITNWSISAYRVSHVTIAINNPLPVASTQNNAFEHIYVQRYEHTIFRYGVN